MIIVFAEVQAVKYYQSRPFNNDDTPSGELWLLF